MKSSKSVGAAWSVLVAALLVAGCNGGEASENRPDSTASANVRAVNVEVVELAPREFTEVLRLTATVRASRDVVISAEESGRVVTVVVDKGATVRAGQPLLRIDDSLLRSQVQQAQAAADLARETHERRKRLWEQEKIGSELAYLQARYDAAQAAASLATLRQRLAHTVVRAPIDGTVEDRRVEVGSIVAPGTPLMRIVDISPVKVAAGVPERFAQEVSVGREVEITFGALGADAVRGRIAFVGNTVDEQSRTFPIEVEVPNPSGRFKPEMVAGIRLPLRRLEDALVVPQQALVRAEGGFQAYVAVERGGVTLAEQRTVVLGPTGSNEAVIASGLHAGEKLIVVGQQKVADGDPVTVVGAPPKGGTR